MTRANRTFSVICITAVAAGPAVWARAQPPATTPREQALDFIRNETQFHLGYLPTEQSHPKTRGLSLALQSDTAQGLRQLLSVDKDLPPLLKQVNTP